MKVNPEEPAFPIIDETLNPIINTGMNIRTQLAAMAMQGLLGNVHVGGRKNELLAELAVRQADALIAELNK